MNYVAWVVGAVVVVAVGYYLWVNAPTGNTSPSEQSAAVGEVSRSGSGTFADLASLGGDYECTVSMGAEGSGTQGTIYVSGGQMRADFSTSVEGQSVASSMIRSGDYIYTWSDMAPQGFKMKIDTAAQGSTAAPTGNFDLNAAVNYNCAPWVSNATQFEVPATVTFMEAPSAQ